MRKSDLPVADDDNPPLTDRQLADLRPASDVFTADELAALAAARPAVSPKAAVEVRIRISPETLAAFKAGGPGWQGRMRTALEKAAVTET